MASSSLSRTWRYRVFTSFHGPDVRKTFLSHLRKQFSNNGITMFDDEGIERSQIIAPALMQAIGESRIFIVVLSKNYASSSWCLDELLEILKCKEDRGQIVMTVFHGVDPSDVRKQTGEFGSAFNKTCAHRTEEDRRKWSQALNHVGCIAGEHFLNWKNEAEMIEKIARDVSDKLNDTPSRDFNGMVGIEAHLRNMLTLLQLDYDGVKVVGISGPAGIGKSTIAKALQSRLSNRFQLTCFVDNLKQDYTIGHGEYDSKLRLQEKLLSNIFNQNGITIRHGGVIQDRLHDQRVLIILDDVDSLYQLEALANELGWFGPGSRVIVTTENNEILQQHGINDVYHVCFPSEREALMIFCLAAFRQTSPPDGFEKLVDEVKRLCGDLPLGLHVLGSSLRGKSQANWIDELPRLKNSLNGRIESVLKVGFDSLHEKDQTLFLHIAVFFKGEHVNNVTSMLEKSNLNVRLGLKILANKYLIHITKSRVVMHRLLQVMAIQVISRQELWKRQILVDAQEICYVLENAAGNGSIVGVSFDVSEISELIIDTGAFERMRNLIFLKVYYGTRDTREIQLHIPEEMEFRPRLRLLHWEKYPRKILPLRFCPVNLVKLSMRDSKLEKLWEGTQPLVNLKEMDFAGSSHLKELPNLSNATNLEVLNLYSCSALAELPSSIANLDKLEHLTTDFCESLQVIPTLTNLVSLESISFNKCVRLRSFPDIPTNVTDLLIAKTAIEEVPASLRHCSRLESVDLSGNKNLKTFSTHLPTSVTYLNLSNSGIEKIADCLKGLDNLRSLFLIGCKKLVSLPELPDLLELLLAEDCESLETLFCPLNTPNANLNFSNCFKLDRQARREIILRPFRSTWSLFPGREVPAEFNPRASGNSLTIPPSAFSRFKVCLVISPTHRGPGRFGLESLRQQSGLLERGFWSDIYNVYGLRTDHLLIIPSEMSRELVVDFNIKDQNFDITQVYILTDETDGSKNRGYGEMFNDDEDEDISTEDSESVPRKRSRKMTMTCV